MKARGSAGAAAGVSPVAILDAAPEHLDALVELENACFDSDRLSRRSFRRFLQSDRDILLVAEQAGGLLGYALVLRRRATRLARLYSLAVRPAARGQGIGERLLAAAEAAAEAAGCVDLRLEVRRDNRAAIALYERRGYRVFAEIPHYYEDREDALRLQKRIHALRPPRRQRVPYYAQSTDFTCGPACLLMAMAALQRGRQFGLKDELDVWREATTVFMTAGHGGCGPHGLALAAVRRGFPAEVVCNTSKALFTDGVRHPQRKAMLEQIHGFFLEDCAAACIPLLEGQLGIGELRARLGQGWMPIVLISHYRMTRQKAPHWIVVTAIDDRFVYLHDPDLGRDESGGGLDKQYIPVDHAQFDAMCRYGQAGHRAVVLVGRPSAG
jgi:ribosomal-protein-alanine acetyltransferase